MKVLLSMQDIQQKRERTGIIALHVHMNRFLVVSYMQRCIVVCSEQSQRGLTMKQIERVLLRGSKRATISRRAVNSTK
jgi:hypothetical protein